MNATPNADLAPEPHEPDAAPDREFETAMLVVRCRWNLTLEAGG